MSQPSQGPDAKALAKKPRGFAALSQPERIAAASKGGRAARDNGTAHRFTSDEARDAGGKGGRTISARPGFMSEIAKKSADARAEKKRQLAAQNAGDTVAPTKPLTEKIARRRRIRRISLS